MLKGWIQFVLMGCQDPRMQAHSHIAISTDIYLDWRSRAVHVVRCCDSWRQTVSHKGKHKQRGQVQTCSTLHHTEGTVVRYKVFLLIPFPLQTVHFLSSSRRGSLVKFCSQSKPRAFFEINIIINFSVTLVSPGSGFGLVYTSKIKTAICAYKGSYKSITDNANL